MLLQQILLPSALLPAAVAATLLAAARVAFRARTEEEDSAAALTLAGLALAAAFVASFLAMTGWPRWFPVEASQRLFFLVGLAGLVSVAAERIAAPWLRHATTALLLGLTFAGVLETPIRHTWSGIQSVAALGAVGAFGFAAAAAWGRHTAATDHALLRSAVRVAVVTAVSVSLGLSGTARMAQLCGALAAAVTVVELYGLVLARRGAPGAERWRAAHAPVPVLILLGLLLIGHFYAELQLAPALLLGAALLLLGAPGPRTWTLLAPLVAGGIALGLVTSTFLQQPDDPYGGYYCSHPRSPSAPLEVRETCDMTGSLPRAGAGAMAALLALVACQAEEAPAEPDPIRIALFNIKELQTTKLSQLDATGRGHHPQLLAAAQIIAQVRPDVLVVQEIDRPPGPDGTRPAEVFYESYIQQAWPDVNLVHLFAGPSNTGTLSGLDLNGDGHVATTADEGDRRHGDDSYGFGTYPGQYSMAVYSRWPLAIDEIRTFQNLLWKDLPGHHMPQDFFAPEVEGALRLSSKSHWDIPVVLESGARLHLWVSHPTPPVFDGDEDKNGRRNHDEIRFWKLYASGDSALTDDAGP